ncbi:MAG TPA: cupin domain-containing protein [Chitinophagaceae bacterium]|nr:cupin domain-containing protein [Chitinophagaceae bacterium]
MNFQVSLAGAAARLHQQTPQRFTTVMKNGSMSVEYYAPLGVDLQTPHVQDELYVIIRGSGLFYRDGHRVAFGPGDVLFVPAGMEHRFEQFSDDFATWVIFYGPSGGEVPPAAR